MCASRISQSCPRQWRSTYRASALRACRNTALGSRGSSIPLVIALRATRNAARGSSARCSFVGAGAVRRCELRRTVPLTPEGAVTGPTHLRRAACAAGRLFTGPTPHCAGPVFLQHLHYATQTATQAKQVTPVRRTAQLYKKENKLLQGQFLH